MNKQELFDIPGFSRYAATENGDLFSRDYKRTGAVRKLKPAITGGYYKTMLKNDNGKYITVSVHRIIARTFHGVRPIGFDVDHVNGIKTDNRAGNLEYVTHSVNCQRSFDLGLQKKKRGSLNGMAKLTENDVFEIRKHALKFNNRGYGKNEIAKKYGVSSAHIKDIVSKRRNIWPHVSV
jgi:hypothetical protein